MTTGEIISLKVSKIGKDGLHLKYSDEKELPLPHEERISDINQDEKYLVIVCFDKKNNVYFASEKIDQHLIDVVINDELQKGDEVEITTYAKTPLGMKASINKKYRGILYKDEIFKNVKLEQTLMAFIKDIREDGKIDLILQPQTYKQVPEITQTILTKLEKMGGFLPFNDKSDPEKIYKEFGISKRVFKQTIGALYKQRKITITDKGIETT